ncbi:hypothetical protein VitviT2T_002834 [Vitis vinifera]|uniref:Uncharacterized protein n=1 Tax=Vitis vinifera TaxID=29760 RepID=A0ABY9BJP5_VITVI|nr:hypothetical protein VitviT2T_002834 [Vitis vinifera]
MCRVLWNVFVVIHLADWLSIRGLLHPNVFVKHGTLRLLLEELKFLDSFISAINHTSCSSNQMMHRLAPLKQEIENGVRMLLPAPQVLLTLPSSLSSQSTIQELGLKRKRSFENFTVHRRNDRKKLKTDVLNEDTDTIVSGISSGLDIAFHGGDKALDTFTADDMDSGKDNVKIIAKTWGLQPSSMAGIALRDVETCFLSKLLDALKIYVRIMPTVLEGSLDFFINLLGNSSALSTDVQQFSKSMKNKSNMLSTRLVLTKVKTKITCNDDGQTESLLPHGRNSR